MPKELSPVNLTLTEPPQAAPEERSPAPLDVTKVPWNLEVSLAVDLLIVLNDRISELQKQQGGGSDVEF